MLDASATANQTLLDHERSKYEQGKTSANAADLVRAHARCILDDPLSFEGYLTENVTEAAAAADWTAHWESYDFMSTDETPTEDAMALLEIDVAALMLVMEFEAKYNEFLEDQLETLLAKLKTLQLDQLSA
jgi:hypothetical protein